MNSPRIRNARSRSCTTPTAAARGPGVPHPHRPLVGDVAAEPRTGHNITNVEILERRGSEIDLRHNWLSLYYRYNTTDTYFGTNFVTLDVSGPEPVIRKKKIVLKNDYIHHIVDVYVV